jgi:RNA polymerase sigma-70 factor (ECF subfamily)
MDASDPDSASLSPESTENLLRRTQAGDPLARERLAGRYLPRLKRVAHGRVPAALRSLIDTEDLVQDSLSRAFTNLEAFESRHQGAFLGYLRQILLNRLRDEIRRAKVHQAAVLKEDLSPAALRAPLEEAIGAETLQLYEAALAKLRPEQIEAVVMRIEMGFSYREIAEALAKPSDNAARMLVTRSLARLAVLIREGGAIP